MKEEALKPNVCSIMEQTATPSSSARKISRGLQILQDVGIQSPAQKKAKSSSSKQASTPSPGSQFASNRSGARALPIEYSHLLKVLENLLLAYRTRPKGQLLSFAIAKQALSKMNIRFEIKHLAQIIHLCPELSWQNVQTSRDSTPRERLMILIASSNTSTSSTNDALIVQRLRMRLMDILTECKDEGTPTIPEAGLPDPAASIVSTPSASSKRSSGSRSVVSPYIRSPASIGRRPGTATPEASQGKQWRKPISMSPHNLLTCGEIGLGQLSPVVESEEGSSKRSFDKDSLMKTPVRKHKRNIEWDDLIKGQDPDNDPGITALSSASKQAIQKIIHVQELMSPEQVRGRQKGHALAILTETFDLVRAIFHRHKATVMGVELVLEKMKLSQGGKKGPKDDTVRFNLHQLLEYSSPYLRLDISGTQARQVLVIDQRANLKQTRDHLKQVASNRGSCELDPEQDQSARSQNVATTPVQELPKY